VTLRPTPRRDEPDNGTPPAETLATSGYFTGLPLARFGAGIVDPGWRFGTYSDKGRGKCADQKYRCDSLADIKAMPVGTLFKPDAAIALWFTQYAGHWAPEVLEAWGFEPRTLGAWAKQTSTGRKWFFGQGKILRSAAEFYMIGVRGKPPVRSHSIRNLIVAKWRRHSRKPDQLHHDMAALYDGPYVELFARYHAPGWTGWGNQLEPEKDHPLSVGDRILSDAQHRFSRRQPQNSNDCQTATP
jgi:N6-adenosine-specific RNA methylase IME4